MVAAACASQINDWTPTCCSHHCHWLPCSSSMTANTIRMVAAARASRINDSTPTCCSHHCHWRPCSSPRLLQPISAPDSSPRLFQGPAPEKIHTSEQAMLNRLLISAPDTPDPMKKPLLAPLLQGPAPEKIHTSQQTMPSRLLQPIRAPDTPDPIRKPLLVAYFQRCWGLGFRV